VKRPILPLLVLLLAAILLASHLAPADTESGQGAKKEASLGKAYGEWRIRVRPDKGAEYRQLIESKGLPLFRKAGGRMVGWWNTQIGNLYEHVTIWEYDDMAAFGRAGQILGADPAFARFVALRDPLLAGEESRFLRLTPFAEKPRLPEPAKAVIHEIHRVPLKGMAAYLKFVEEKALPIVKKHGFRPVGPWTVDVGKWREVTFLFRFESLAERERLIARFAAHADVRTYAKINELVDEIETRLLIPTAFKAEEKRALAQPEPAPGLPHLEQIAPGVFAAGFAHRHDSANCGWVALKDSTLLVDLPRGIAVPDFLKQVARVSGKPVRTLALTHFQPSDAPVVESLLEHGIVKIHASPAIRRGLLAASKKVEAVLEPNDVVKPAIGDDLVPVDYLDLDGITGPGGAAVHLRKQHVLFAGPFVVHGPRTRLPGSDTGRWIVALRYLEKLEARRVVPGFGSWGSAEVLTRQRRFLTELRRQVGYVIARGRPRTDLATEVRIPADYLVWMPYDTPTAEDLAHVYGELTVPAAPFNGRPPSEDKLAHALVLIGDEPHEPGHIEEGLRPVFEATNVVPHFAVDVRTLTADNLAKVRLLVILRDGLQRPRTGPKSEYVWMTPEQEQAVVDFVDRGGGVLCLHNALGLYPAGGPYLKLMGGRYIGHGPLERFRVEVTDRDHPVTRGVRDFSVADEQHTPVPDKGKVHLLLQNRSDEGKTAPAGWTVESGRGRVCHLANGHTREALLHPMFQLLMRNGVQWCLHREGKRGAPRSRPRKEME
jgi:type 1 glutamine amidotransferase